MKNKIEFNLLSQQTFLHVLSIVLSFVVFSNCISKKVENFGWAKVDESNLNEVEKKFLKIPYYHLSRENLIFGTNETIYYIYNLPSSHFSKKKSIHVGLYKYYLSYNLLTIEEKQVEMPSYQINGKINSLEEGKYQLKFIYELDPFDQIEFEVRDLNDSNIEF